ncbi:MAG: hypothetical protein R3F43_19300 [bacterium]
MGLRASATQLVLEGCRVPAAHRLGPEGIGFRITRWPAWTRAASASARPGLRHRHRGPRRGRCCARAHPADAEAAARREADAWVRAGSACACAPRALKDAGRPFTPPRRDGQALLHRDGRPRLPARPAQPGRHTGQDATARVEAALARDARITRIYEGTSEGCSASRHRPGSSCGASPPEGSEFHMFRGLAPACASMRSAPGRPAEQAAVVPTEGKLRLIAALTAAGLPRIGITSFVNPRWIRPWRTRSSWPRPGRAPECGAATPRSSPTSAGWASGGGPGRGGGLHVGLRDPQQAQHQQDPVRGRGRPSSQPVFERCAAAGWRCRPTSARRGAARLRAVAPEVVRDVSARLLAMGAYEVNLGDTIGVGTPLRTRRLLDGAAGRPPRRPPGHACTTPAAPRWPTAWSAWT